MNTTVHEHSADKLIYPVSTEDISVSKSVTYPKMEGHIPDLIKVSRFDIDVARVTLTCRRTVKSPQDRRKTDKDQAHAWQQDYRLWSYVLHLSL
jgi:hypothetical protein